MPRSAGRRTLKNVCLDLLAATDASEAILRASSQYENADNMTDRMAALETLALHDRPERAAALEDFYARYADDPLIIDKWLALQAAIPEPATLDRVRALTEHPAFSMANPNRVRSLIGSFAQANSHPIQPARRRRLRFRRRYRARARPEEPASGRPPDGRVPLLARARSRAARARASDAAPRRGGTEPVARRRRHRRPHAGRELTRAIRNKTGLLRRLRLRATRWARRASVSGSRLAMTEQRRAPQKVRDSF